MIYAARSERGLRNRNEDNILVPEHGNVPLIAVADGMGGHNAGQTASRIAIQTLQALLFGGEGKLDEAAIRNAVIGANDAVLKYSKTDASYSGMGTTLVLALLREADFIAANVGDSRLYHFDGSRLTQVTEDHSYVAELVAAGQITKEQARVHPRRNLITRALGTRNVEKVDIFTCAWGRGDILLLCSDGLYDALTDEMIAEMLSEPDINASCDKLVETALAEGSTDNISIVLARNTEASHE